MELKKMKTCIQIADAVEESQYRNRIVEIDYVGDEIDLAQDCHAAVGGETNTSPDEVWGTDDDGDEYRLRIRREKEEFMAADRCGLMWPLAPKYTG